MKNWPDFSIPGSENLPKIKLTNLVSEYSLALRGHECRNESPAIPPQRFVSYTIEHETYPRKGSILASEDGWT